jgi:uncharacterized membrane protein YbaN (DUF454 family)
LSVISLKSALPNKSIIGEYVLKTLKTVDEVVEFYFSSSSRLRSNIYIILGSVFVFFAIVGIWVPGWPTVSWAVPAAFLFSLSSEKLFRWTLTNEYFGSALFDYYSSGKTLPNHVKRIIALFIISMSLTSSYFVWLVSTKGDGELLVISSWDGADSGFGFITIILVGLIGVWYVLFQVKSR